MHLVVFVTTQNFNFVILVILKKKKKFCEGSLRQSDKVNVESVADDHVM